MPEDIELKVHLAFDEEASVWYVRESDVPGLRLEAGDPMDLVRRIAENVAELIALNEDEVLARKSNRAARPTVRFTPIFEDSMPAAAYA
ncbi:DUF1902 domain-containing protein [Sphingomonas sp.]|uniref:DUF1902 domain-containing protein n=1 Tax=Sphingomonas sp. TaxID=28214 RepID=UPI0025E3E058|nr:DUF1902 domain-containing protein [Sphingomonas sp.]